MRFLVGILFIVGCHPRAEVGVQNIAIEPDSQQQCAAQCVQVGMTLDSIVIMASRVGCVCRAATATPVSPTAAPSAAAGALSAIIDDEQAAARASRRNSSSKK